MQHYHFEAQTSLEVVLLIIISILWVFMFFLATILLIDLNTSDLLDPGQKLQIQNNQSLLKETEKIVNVKIMTIISTITSTLLCYISLFFGY